jgi:hypothetical protein
MEILNVIAAAVGAWVFGALWYGLLSKPWMAASGVRLGADGRPANGSSPAPYVISFVMMLVVAGMMRHVFSMTPAIDTLGKGIVAGLGVGAFLITPWIAINNTYGMRPLMLTAIDGAYATIGCAIIGGVLVLF